MIREAQLADVPKLVEMGLRFIALTPYATMIKGDRAQLTKFISSILEHQHGFVSEESGFITGMIGVALFNHPMSGELTALEVCWWVDPEYRGAGAAHGLMKRAEQFAKESGAKRMQMVAPNEKVARLYEFRGYKYVESTYQKDV